MHIFQLFIFYNIFMNDKDDFGITCVVDSDGLLATPNSIDR